MGSSDRLDYGEIDAEAQSPHSTNNTPDGILIRAVLSTVVQSVSNFKPSPSLTNLQLDKFGNGQGKPTILDEIDVVCTGGGLKGYFMVGAREVLMKQLQQHNLQVRRYAGASCGGWCAFFMSSGISSADWLRTYTLSLEAVEMAEKKRITIHDAYRDTVWPWLSKVLHEDTYLRCSGRCFISITVCDPLPRNVIVSTFTSNQDLFDACLASSTIPFLTERGVGPLWRGYRVLDGGITNNCPVFTDRKRRQIVVNFAAVQYPILGMLSPKDPCIEGLILSGAIQMARFLEGRPCSRAISWGREKRNKPGGYFKKALFVFAFLALMRLLLRRSFRVGAFSHPELLKFFRRVLTPN